MSLKNVACILANAPVLNRLSITTLCYYVNAQDVEADFIVLQNRILPKVCDSTNFRFKIEGVTNDIPMEQIEQLFHNFPALNFLRCQKMWSDRRPTSCIGFVLLSR